MRPPRNPIVTPDDDRPENHRRHGRIRTEELQCCLGNVIDLSASGMRVAGRGRNVVQKDQVVEMTLRHAEVEFEIKCRVAHVTRAGFRKHVIGLEFIDLSDEDRGRVFTLANTAGDTRVFV